MTRVLVVGAGIGGLTLGIALARAGVEVDLYERAGELREVGAAVALSANGTRELYRLGVGEALDAVSTQPTELIYRDGRTGARIAAHPGAGTYRERFGAPYWGVHRVDLQQTLAHAFTAAAGAAHLHLGHTVTAVDPDAGTLTLDAPAGHAGAGVEVAGDVVVGADGVHSTVRDAVAGPGSGPVYSGTSAFRGLVAVDALPSLPDPRAIQFWVGDGAHLLHYALGRDDDTVNFFAVICGPATWTGGNRPAADNELLDAFAGWHPAVREMLAAAPQSPRWPLLSQPALTRWTRGRAVLIGDAVHAMLPHHGQGANQSIEDAVTLARLITRDGPASALAAYPRLRRARTRAVAASAWDTGTLLHLADDHPRVTERDKRFATYLPDNAWVHDHDVTDPSTTTVTPHHHRHHREDAMTSTQDQSVSPTVTSDAVTAGSHATEIARSGASNQRGPAAGGVDRQRVATVVGAALDGIRAAIRENAVTYEEFDAFKQWLIGVSDTGEWPLFLDVYLEFEVEKVAAQTQQGSVGTILGPFWLAGQAQLATPATLPMRDDEPGTPMILAGQVTSTDGTPLDGATVDIWHTDSDGWYSGFAATPPAGNLRGVVTADGQGRYEIHTRRPAPYTIPLDGPTGAMTQAAGWSPWRPAHIHLLVAAPGHRTLTTQLFFTGDPYLGHDVASADKPDLTLDPQPTGNAAPGFDGEVRSDRDFVLEPE